MSETEQTSLDAIGARLAALSERLSGLTRIERPHWAEVGALLLEARVAHGGNDKAFGRWIRENGADRMPGLKTPSARSAVIWMAQHPERVALVDPETARSPKRIRTAWRDLVKAEAGRLAPAVAEGAMPESEAVDAICAATAATRSEALRLLRDALEARAQVPQHAPVAAPDDGESESAAPAEESAREELPAPPADTAPEADVTADAQEATDGPWTVADAAEDAAPHRPETAMPGASLPPPAVVSEALPLEEVLNRIVERHGLETVRLALDAMEDADAAPALELAEAQADPEEPNRWRGVDVSRPAGRITVMDVRKILLDAFRHDFRRDGMLIDVEGFDVERWAPRARPSKLGALLEEAARKLTPRFLQEGDDPDDPEAWDMAFEEAEPTLAEALRKAGVVTAEQIADWPREPDADFVQELLDEGAPERPLRALWPGWFEREDRKAAFIRKHGKTAWEAVRLARLMTSKA